jgi:serine protease AprX
MWHTGAVGPGSGGRARLGRRAKSGRRKAWSAAACATAVAALAGTSVAAAPAASASSTQQVIVTSSGLLSPASAVLGVLGTVLTQYHIINGVEATVPTFLVPLLESLPGITVTPDVSVNVQSTTPPESSGPHSPTDAFLQQTGASQLAAAGDTGQGATVAVMDTGIDNLPDFAGRLIGGVDLSGGNNPFEDDYGHGTFVAGLIAGNGGSSNGQYSGEAPGANLVSIKVAGASGSTRLGTLISGLQWAVDHESTYGIDVLNISLGYQPTESTVLNPLDQAVEAAWNSGIAVVTSAGNAGPFNGTILSPGDDPLAITAGALDDLGQADVSSDEMNDFSSVGPTSQDGWAKPDLVTSGRSVVSLAAPGSTVYNQNPSARVGSANFVGSGTSFSAAITSGAAALVLTDNPGLTPNQLKARLLANTNPGPAGNPFVDGHGALNAYAAATSSPMDFSQSDFLLLPVVSGLTVSLLPSLSQVDTWNANLWTGYTPPAGPSGSSWNGTSWSGSAWNGSASDGSDWVGRYWNNSAWNSAVWAGSAWDGRYWNNGAWNGSAWVGRYWNCSQWD